MIVEFLICVIKDKVVFVHSMKACRSNRRGTDPLILNFGVRWRSAVTSCLDRFTSWK